MIKVKENENYSSSNNLDGLVNSFCKLYDVPASLIPKMKSGLEETLYQYLSKFLSENGIRKVEESSGVDYDIPEDLDTDSVVSRIVESARMNGVVNVKYNGNNLISLINISESMTYSLGESLDISKLSSDHLIEAWKCEDVLEAKSLLKDIINLTREEA